MGGGAGAPRRGRGVMPSCPPPRALQPPSPAPCARAAVGHPPVTEWAPSPGVPPTHRAATAAPPAGRPTSKRGARTPVPPALGTCKGQSAGGGCRAVHSKKHLAPQVNVPGLRPRHRPGPGVMRSRRGTARLGRAAASPGRATGAAGTGRARRRPLGHVALSVARHLLSSQRHTRPVH